MYDFYCITPINYSKSAMAVSKSRKPAAKKPAAKKAAKKPAAKKTSTKKK
jgi:hypothetical protein